MAKLAPHSRRQPGYRLQLWLLLAPYLAGLLLLIVVPLILGFGSAFFSYDGISPPRWAGWLNFGLLATESLFPLSLQNSLALALPAVPLRVLIAFLTALALRQSGPGIQLLRGLIFLPSLIPPAAYALAWLWILNPLYGPLNLLLRAIGVLPPDWLVDPLWAKPGLILMLLWPVGEGFLVSLAALQSIPPSLEEAARIDGASAWGRLRFLILPMIAPVLLLLALRDLALVLQDSFVAVLLMTGGDPYYATYTLPLLIYELGFDQQALGVAGAGLWVLYALSGLLVLAMYLIARGWDVSLSEERGIV